MDLSPVEAQREVESLKRFIHERERQHAKELDTTKEHAKEQVEALDRNQREEFERLHTKTKEQVEKQHESYVADLDKTNKNAIETADTLKKDYYDRTGRIVHEHTRNSQKDKEFRTRQMEDLMYSNKHNNENERAERDRYLKQSMGTFEREKRDLEKYVKTKLDTQREASADAMSDLALSTRHQIDDNVRDNHEAMSRQKLSDKLAYRMLADQTSSERESIKNASGLREKQLADEKRFQSEETATSGAKTIEDHRRSMASSNARSVNDMNFELAQKKQRHANQIELMNTDHKTREMDMRNQLRHVQNELNLSKDSARNEDNFRRDLMDRRHKQENFLTSEALRHNNQISQDNLKERFRNEQHKQVDKHQEQQKIYAAQVNDKLNEVQQLAARERQESEFKQSRHISDATRHADQQKFNLVAQYEDLLDEMDDLRSRTDQASKADAEKRVNDIVLKTQRDIYRTNRDNQAKVFETKETLKNHISQLEYDHRDRELGKEMTARDQFRRLKSTYGRSLTDQQQHFDDMADEFKYDAQLDKTRIRQESDFGHRKQLLEMQAKNRILINNYENKMATAREEQEAELSRVKAESERTLRDTMKRTKEILENERRNHEKGLAMKDLQTNEKLRLQREAFEQQIDKLRRTNELSIKKG